MVHVYKRQAVHTVYVNYCNISPTFIATRLSIGLNNNNKLNYRSAKTQGFLLNSKFLRELCFTKVCFILAVMCNIQAHQIQILTMFHMFAITDLSRINILHQNYLRILAQVTQAP